MGRSSYRSWAVAVAIGVVGAACAQGGSESSSPSADEPAAQLEAVADVPGVRTEDRCDLGFNTARFNETTTLMVHGPEGHDAHRNVGNVDFTLEDWAGEFVDEQLGMTAQAVVDELQAQEIYRRHILGGVLTHTLGPDPWMPMTDRAACEALAAELEAARAVAVRYPTVADARAAGYVLGDSYHAGLGVHFQNWDYLEAFDPAHPVQLLYAGAANDAAVVGLSYVVIQPGSIPPEGFSGANDAWHRHRSFCLDGDEVNISADILSLDECAALGGTYIPNDTAWMLHVWLIPGCESDWGLYSAANPQLPYLPEGAALGAGCGSGLTLADPLDLDDRGGGPHLR